MTRRPPQSSGGDKTLTEADHIIWRKVARTVRPMSPDKAVDDFHRAMEVGGVTNTSKRLRPMVRVDPTAQPETASSKTQVDYMADKNVRRGKIVIDKKIDLHDMTRAQAEPTLLQAIEAAYEKRLRCLLVVTGKGARLQGILRKTLPEWLNDPRVRSKIASYAQAHIRHGGTGAWYVLIKRKR